MPNRGIEKFLTDRQPQPDAEFVRQCGLPAHPLTPRLALGVRAVIAQLSEVDPQLIHAADAFDGPLGGLPFWDSLDSVQLLMSLEEELDVRIADHEAETIRNPELAPCTVREFVIDVGRLCLPKMTL